jgi:hypothetical protein
MATLGAALVMTAVLWGWLRLTAAAPSWVIGAGGVILGAAVYFAAALALGAPEARRLAAAARRPLQG